MAVKRWANVTSWELVPQVLDVAGLMSLLRISKPTALKYLAEGSIPAVRMGKGWREDFNAMAMKTVYRRLIGKWGVMSIDYRQTENVMDALTVEGRTYDDNGGLLPEGTYELPFDNVETPQTDENGDIITEDEF